MTLPEPQQGAPRAAHLPAGASPRRSRPLAWLGCLAALVVGSYLLYGVYGKGLDAPGFAAGLETKGLTGGLPPLVVAYAGLALEALLGVLLVLNVRRMWVLVPTLLLVCFFMSVTGKDWWDAEHGNAAESASCICFGNVMQRTPKEAFLQDLAFMFVPALLAFLGRQKAPPRFPPVRTRLALGLTAAVVVFAHFAPSLDLDDWATQLKPGRLASEICVGSGDTRQCLTGAGEAVPALATGRHLLVLTELAEPAFLEGFGALNAYQVAWETDPEPKRPLLWALTASEDIELFEMFDHETGRPQALFTIYPMPAALVAPLHRHGRLPRSFLLEDGRVTETWSGLPPAILEMAKPAESSSSD